MSGSCLNGGVLVSVEKVDLQQLCVALSGLRGAPLDFPLQFVSGALRFWSSGFPLSDTWIPLWLKGGGQKVMQYLFLKLL